MKVPDFRPATESDYPDQKDKGIFEIIDPAQKAIKDIVRWSQGNIQTDNINEKIIEIKIIPGVWNNIEIGGIKGPPQGAVPILVDCPIGYLGGWNIELIDATHFNFFINVLPYDPSGDPITEEVLVRIWVKGS